MRYIRHAFLPFRRILDFRGRSRASEVFGFILLWFALEFVVGLGAVLVSGEDGDALPVAILRAALAVPAVGLGMRRLHDSGLSGWWLLVAIPAFNIGNLESFLAEAASSPLVAGVPEEWRNFALSLPKVVLLALLVRSGDDGSNRYGPDPRDTSATPL